MVQTRFDSFLAKKLSTYLLLTPLMTVKRITAAGYRVCYWYERNVYHERMFLPEMVVREHISAPPSKKGTDPTKNS